ncbi:MAG: (2Fe-2S) ferredoxin domain-containing protein [Bacteroidales bacterium]
MEKIKSLADLRKIKEGVQNHMNLREKGENADHLVQIKVAMATCGIAAGAKEVMERIIQVLENNNVAAVVTQTGCMGYCYAEPTVEVRKPGEEPLVFGYVNPAKAEEIVHKYILQGEMLDGILPVNYETIDKK